MSQQSLTVYGVTVGIPDAQRAANFVKAQPATAQGRANIQWEMSFENPTGVQFRAALLFAKILSLFGPFTDTDRDGTQIGTGTYSFIYEKLFVPPVTLSTDSNRFEPKQ